MISQSELHVYLEAQKQLIRVLAHHLVRVGKEVRLLDQNPSETSIIEKANRQWKRSSREGKFEMKEMPAPDTRDASMSQGREVLAVTSQRRYHLSATHSMTATCKPVGGFGTCIKDCKSDHFPCSPLPTDHPLASHQQLPPSPWSGKSPTIALDSDFISHDGLAYGESLTSEVSFLTPQNIPDHTHQIHVCCYCGATQSPYDTWDLHDLCQLCSSLYPGTALPNDELDRMTTRLGSMNLVV